MIWYILKNAVKRVFTCKISFCRKPAKICQKLITTLRTRTATPSSSAPAAARRSSRCTGRTVLAFGYATLVRVSGRGGKIGKFCKFLAGSFSAVSKRNFARKYAFDSIFQALQDLHPFAPLQSQNFRQKSV